jgi:hypothetical protein
VLSSTPILPKKKKKVKKFDYKIVHGGAQVAEYLPGKHEALIKKPQIPKKKKKSK